MCVNLHFFHFNLICNMICNVTTYRNKKYLTFWPKARGQGCVLEQPHTCFHGGLCSITFLLICNMTTFRKRYGLTFWTPPWGRGCVCGQKICYHVAACVVSSNLKCNATIFRKSLILASAPPLSPTRGSDPGLQTKIRLICFISIAPLPAWKISANNIDNCLSYCEI